MPKPRILIPITVQFSVRYILRTGLLARMLEYADPVIVLGWRDKELEAEFDKMGVSVHFLPKKKIGRRYARLLKQIYQWQVTRIASPTSEIDRKRYRLVYPLFERIRIDIRDFIFRLALKIPGYVERMQNKQKRLVWEDTNIIEYLPYLKEVPPALIFSLTPYFIEEELLLHAAHAENIPILVSYLSFDNLTTRNYIPMIFDKYLLWNEYNRSELLRIYPTAKEKLISLVGAPQFDFYYNKKNIWDETVWRKALNLPEEKTVILFGGTGKVVAPHEQQWLYHLDAAIENEKVIGNPIILLRRHPNDPPEYWQTIISQTKNVIASDPWEAGKENAGKTNITQKDIELLASTLFHSQVHINASSTMTIDGAIFDRPQIGPAYDESGVYAEAAEELYRREHYLPITNSKGLTIVYSREELVAAVNEALESPEKGREGRQKLVRDICLFTDGKSAERVNAEIKDFIRDFS